MRFLSHEPLSSIWMIMFWVCLTALLYTYIGYPIMLRAIALLLKREIPVPAKEHSMTLLICAHNEAEDIGRKLRDTLSLDYSREKLQILVVSDGSTDGTDEIVKSFVNEGVQLLRIERQSGKTFAQNTAIHYATGDIVVFSDATTFYHPMALQFIAGNFTNPKVGAVSGRYAYFDPTDVSPTASGARAYAGYDNNIRQLQSRIASITGCCGCIYAVRRTLYTHLGSEIISDLVQPLHVLLKGYSVKLEPRALAWEHATVSSKKEFSMRVRVVTRALIGLNSVNALLLPWRYPWTALQLFSHKIFRWAVPFFLLGIFTSAFALRATPLHAGFFYAQLAVYLIAAATALVPIHKHLKILGIPLYFCVVNAAAVTGIVQYFRGKRYTSWNPDRKVSGV